MNRPVFSDARGPVTVIVALGLIALVGMLQPRPTGPASITPDPTHTPAHDTRIPTLPTATPNQPRATPVPPTATFQPATATPFPVTATGIPATPLPAAEWKTWPIIPTLSPRALALYAAGLAQGNNPRAFSKVGDCSGTPNWFLGDFDRGPRFYALGEYARLQTVIDYYAGSFARESLAAHPGFKAGSLFDPLWTNPQICGKGNGPLACEYAQQHPSVAFIMLGTNDVYHLDEFEPNLRRIIDYSIAHGVLPVLSTKADNLEGNEAVNTTVAQLAAEYELPLWNYWRLAQTLPQFGLQEDGAHLNWAPNKFDNPENMTRGWPNRNLTALQVLDAVMQATDQTTP